MELLVEYPRLIDVNAKSKLFRDRKKLLIVGRCLTVEHPEVIGSFSEHAILTACPEAEHINMLGFKLFGIAIRSNFDEIAVLTTDGSMHCIQLHYMVEELARHLSFRRRHLVYENGKVVEIPPEVVKISRYLSKVLRLYRAQQSGNT